MSNSMSAVVFNSKVAGPDWGFCHAILPRVSRTFALSIAMLPVRLREPIAVSYLLCRLIDTIEDEPSVPFSDRRRAFELFDAVMRGDSSKTTALIDICAELNLGSNDAELELCEQAATLFACFESLPHGHRAAARSRILEMSAGMRLYSQRAARVGKLRMFDVADLERYCHFVAGTVGKLLTGLFEEHLVEEHLGALTPEQSHLVKSLAPSFGIGLQLVNIVKDVAEDLERGDCFVPQALAEDAGMSVEKLLSEQHRDAALSVIHRLCESAEGHLERAVQYTLAWPTNAAGIDVRTFCFLPLALALATLNEVRFGNDTLTAGKTPKVSRALVVELVQLLPQVVPDNTELQDVLGRLSTWPLAIDKLRSSQNSPAGEGLRPADHV